MESFGKTEGKSVSSTMDADQCHRRNQVNQKETNDFQSWPYTCIIKQHLRLHVVYIFASIQYSLNYM